MDLGIRSTPLPAPQDQFLYYMWRFVIIDICWEIDRQIETDLFPLLDLTEIGSVSILRKSPSLSWEPAIRHTENEHFSTQYTWSCDV